MKYLDLSFPGAAQNLACDEALLEAAEEEQSGETLRFWETSQRFVVLGYSDKAGLSAKLEACREHSIGLWRRPTGGGAVLQGPGCLNYALILRIDGPDLDTIAATNRFIMRRHRAALAALAPDPAAVTVEGVSDLALDGRKFSGNAQRRKRRALLFHGTFLLEFDIAAAEQFLTLPPRQPAYRRERAHREFLTNFPATSNQVKTALKHAWDATVPAHGSSSPRLQELARRKYPDPAWTFRF